MKKVTLAFVAVAISLSACKETTKQDNVTGSSDTAVLKTDNVPAADAPKAAWDKVDWNSPIVKYDEVTATDINIRGNDQYGIYGLGENVLFATGKSEIRKDAAANLDQVIASINQRYDGGQIKVYGYADATGSASDNNALSASRAEAVKNYLTTEGKIAADRVSMYAEGESNPAATNGTASGRMQNRRVEIVAMKK